MVANLTRLFSDFFESEKSGGLVLIICTIVSVILANTALGADYIDFWHQYVGFAWGGLQLNLSVEHWINDGLMAVFFLMVGLEIERELYIGELHPLKNAVLPVAAAIGGMAVPALLYAIINFNTPTIGGFGIPMATDIAFAIAVLSLLGSRVPASLKILLTAIAIVDDLGAILVIAIFYGGGIQWLYFGLAAGIFLFLLLLNRLRVYHVWIYLVLGAAMWYCTLQSGIHATIAGVLLAFAIPFGNGDEQSPSYRLQHTLHRWVAFGILPLFVLANTAIAIRMEVFGGLIAAHTLGIFIGLCVGKPTGILLASWLVAKLKIAALPEDLHFGHIFSVGFLAAIGFTMSIFVTILAFDTETLVQTSKIAILITSVLSGLTGYLLLSRFLPARKPRTSVD